MGYFFTLLFITTSYLTPELVFGQLTEYHVEIILVVLALVSSIPNIPGSNAFSSSTAIALYGMTFAVIAAAVAGGWVGGIGAPLYQFLQPVIGYFLIAINCRKKWHLNLTVLALTLASTFFLIRGYQDLTREVSPSMYLYGEGALRRLRGLGWVNDPNDYSQVVVSLLPMIFFWRRPKSIFLNLLLVGIPVATMLFAMYLTHSRGAAVALMVVTLVACRRKVGTLPAAVLAGSIFAASLAIGWGGGRDTTMEAGADRLDLWAGGLQLIRSHPLFGVGAGRFGDFMGITAHNSVVVCAAEIGMIGLFFWVLMLFSTFRLAINLARTAPKADLALTGDTGGDEPLDALRMALPLASEPRPFREMEVAGLPGETLPDNFPPSEVRRMTHLLLIGLSGFLTAGWFLSRTFSVWLFMCCGMMTALDRMGRQEGMNPTRDSFAWLARYSAGISVSLILIVYVILRLRGI